MTRTSLELAVLKTLAYSSLFNYPLTEKEIRTRLIGENISKKELNSTLTKLLSNKQLEVHDNFYTLPKSKKNIKARKTSQKISAIKMKKAKKYANLIGALPNILGVYATGSLAVSNSKKKDDIDLMIITKSCKLWQTRLFLTIILDTLNLRRKPKNLLVQDKLCLNIYLTPLSFTLSKNKRNLYTAYELTQTIPLVDKFSTLNQLLAGNSWIINFLPNTRLPRPTRHQSLRKKPGILEKLAFKLQRFYMSNKITNETITLHSAFFHPHNLSLDIMKKFNKLEEEIKA